MGYESRIYVVEKSRCSWTDENGRRYARKLAEINMSKCHELSGILRHKPATDCYIYADDGNTQIIKDCYGEALKETPLNEALEIVEDVIARSPWDYWMYDVLRATLQSIYDFVGDDDSFVVLHYGY